MIRELKQSLTQEMEKILEKLSNGYHIDLETVVDKIYYINNLVFCGSPSAIINPAPVIICTPEPPPVPEQGLEPTFTLPVIITLETVAVSNTTATSGGNIISNGGDVIIAKGVCWKVALDVKDIPSIEDSFTIEGKGSASFTSLLTNLLGGKTYSIRAYATNSVGTSYGEIKSISTPTTQELPHVETYISPTITSTSILTGGEVLFEGTTPVTVRGICWSFMQNPTINNNKTAEGIGLGSFTSNLTGLAVGTTYYLRAYAINTIGTAYGDEVSVVTLIDAPVVSAFSISNITENSATSGGNVSSSIGGEVLTRGVCWNTSTDPTIANSKTNDGVGLGEFVSNLTGLLNGTFYYIRAYATNSGGTGYSNETGFTTLYAEPVITTTPLTDISQNSVVTGGNITSDGGSTITGRGVCWDTAPNPTIILPTKTLNGSGIGTFVSTITGLLPSNTYYVRAYVISALGITYGNELILNTLAALPTITTAPITGLTTDFALSGGIISSPSTGTITNRGVCYGVTVNPSIEFGTKTNDTGSPLFISTLSNLLPDTNYYVRAFIIHNGLPIYGQEIGFKTNSILVNPPSLPIPGVVTIQSHTTNSITVSVTAATYNGGDVIDSVGLFIKEGSSPTTTDTKFERFIYNTSFSLVFEGLTPGSTYYIRAYAHTLAGYGLSAPVSQQTDLTIVYTVPTILLSRTIKTQTSIILRGQVTNEGNSAITSVSFGRKTSTGVLITDDNLVATMDPITKIFEATYSGLTAGTTYYFKAFATNTTGMGQSSELVETTLLVLPALAVHDPSLGNIKSDTVKAASIIHNLYNNIIVERGFIVSPTYNLNHTGFKYIAPPGIITGEDEAFQKDMAGLIPDTTYYVWAYAITSLGVIIYNTTFQTITTLTQADVLPGVTINEIINLSSGGFTANATVVHSGNGVITENGFCWNTSPASITVYPPNSVKSLTTVTDRGLFNGVVTGLLPNTTYYVKAYAKNELDYGYSPTYITITTPVIIAPTVSTISANAVSYTEADVYGRSSINGGTDISVKGFLYTPRLFVPVPIVRGGVNVLEILDPIVGTHHAIIRGLFSGISYDIAAFAVNLAGQTTVGNQLIFDVPDKPVVQTDPTPIITNTTVTITQTLSGGDQYTVVESRGFYWSTAPFTIVELTRSNVSKYFETTSVIAPYTITGLLPSTTYYIRAVITTLEPFIDMALGQQITITTLSAPPPPIPESPVNTLSSLSIGSPDTQLAYNILLSNSGTTPLYYKLRVQNREKSNAWIMGPTHLVNPGAVQVTFSNYIQDMGASNSIGDEVTVELSDNNGTTWIAPLNILGGNPVFLPL